MDAPTHPVGETLPMEQRVYRLKVVKTFLHAAVPLSKFDAFWDLLEENSFRLTDHHHMCDLIPFIIAQEKADIKAKIVGKPVSVMFDGTSKLGEAMAIVIRLFLYHYTTPNMYSASHKKHDQRRNCEGANKYTLCRIWHKLFSHSRVHA